jgi:PAS domain S-box-containing protein
MRDASSRFFATTSIALCIVERDTLECQAINSAFTRAFGWSDDDLIGKAITEIVHGDEHGQVTGALAELARSGATAELRVRLRTRAGSHVVIDWTVDGGDGVIFCASRDITALEEYEASLRAAEARTRETERLYHQILDSTVDLILVKGAQSHILWANKAFCDYYGMSNEQLQGIIDAPAVEPDYTQQYIRDDLMVWTTGRALHISGEPVTRYDGEVRYFETLKTPIFDAAGQVTMTVGVSRDVTQRRQDAHELRAAKEAAEQANRAKSVFLANMSHELRTPLNAILGYAQLLGQDQELSERHRDAVATIQRSGEHLLLLIGDVLDLAKIEAGKLEIRPAELHLGSFLGAIVTLFEMRASQRRLAFRYTAAPNLPAAIRADETRLRQVLLNLLGNAIKFTERGSVSLDVAYRDGRLRFQISDTGVGIPAEQLAAIFQPFEQVKSQRRSAEGTGLGLAISNQLVTMMGGAIEVSSEVDVGSTFWFDFEPEIVAAWKGHEVSAPSISGYEGPRRKVLIVDDKQENRRLLGLLLEPLGFIVIEAGDGEAAVAAAEAERPDLIIMDLVMPRLDGFEAARRIRARGELQATRIIAASASVFEQDQERSREVGCDAFISKPIRLEEALALVGSVLGLTWRHATAGSRSETASAGRDTHPGMGPSASTALSANDLRRIHAAATIGDIRQILSILEAVKKGVPAGEVAGLETELLAMAKRFASKEIKALVEPLLVAKEE